MSAPVRPDLDAAVGAAIHAGQVLTFPSGTNADHAARWVAELANRFLRDGDGRKVRAVFNDTPMDGYVGDTQRVVFLRWHYERLLRQIASGVVNVHDYLADR